MAFLASLADHPLLGDSYRAGRLAGRLHAALPPPASLAELRDRLPRAAPADGLLWDLLVKTSFGDEFADFSEVRWHLPALEARAHGEGFAQGIRDWLADAVDTRWKPPKRWAGVLRQSTRAELEAMLFVLESCVTWTDFLTRSVATARQLSARRAPSTRTSPSPAPV